MKRTYQPKKHRRMKKHGFLHRSRTTEGRNILARRRRKLRSKLTAQRKRK